MANSVWYEIGRALRRILTSGSAKSSSGTAQSETGARPAQEQAPTQGVVRDAPRRGLESEEVSPGQFGDGATRDLLHSEYSAVRIEYGPHPDGDPDPGEVIWTWVPYVENDGRGKDRPVLIIGRIGGAVVGCYLSTKQHSGFVSVGTGGWDSQGRTSYLSPERLLRITDEGMRREGHVLAKDRFIAAVTVIAREHGLTAP